MSVATASRRSVPSLVVRKEESPEDTILRLLTESNEWRAVAVLVTPALARFLLDNHNTKNRTLYDNRGRTLAAEISGGRWYRSSSGVGFDTDGVITNGQHRLHAIVISGKSTWMMFVFNCDIDSRAVEDWVKSRSEADRLVLSGTSADGKVVAVAKRILLGTHVSNITCGTFPLEHQRRAIEAYREEIEHVWSFTKGFCMNGSVRGLLARAIPHTGVDMARRFSEVAHSLESTGNQDQAAHYFGKWLAKNEDMRGGGAMQRARLYRYTQSALRTYSEGGRITRLAEVTDDLYPVKPAIRDIAVKAEQEAA